MQAAHGRNSDMASHGCTWNCVSKLWSKLHIHQLWVGRLAQPPAASCPLLDSGRSTAVAALPQASLPPPPFQAPVNGNGASNGAAKQQPGWPSLDETAPKGGGKKRIVVLGTGKLRDGVISLAWLTLQVMVLQQLQQCWPSQRVNLCSCRPARQSACQCSWAAQLQPGHSALRRRLGVHELCQGL